MTESISSSNNKHMITLVIPCYNEAGNIEALVQEAFDLLPEALLGELIVGLGPHVFSGGLLLGHHSPPR